MSNFYTFYSSTPCVRDLDT
uniref:Uncharacterized protein n=1 Tax=Lepeophtheirus salmonis TaxID=72036 RepID=A0A0K2TZI7_LEPSM